MIAHWENKNLEQRFKRRKPLRNKIEGLEVGSAHVSIPGR